LKKSLMIAAALVLVVMMLGACSLGDTLGDLAEEEGGGVTLSSDNGAPNAEVPPQVSGHVTEDANANLGTVEFNGEKYEPKSNITNILLMGVDSDAERVKNNSGWRSDMLMLVTMDKDTNKITCTSIPRDTRAVVHKLDSEGNISSSVTEKINHAYAYGGGPNKYSAQNAMRCVAELLECDGLINVPIDYYISIDLDGVPKLANAIGGVEVTLDQNVPGVGDKGETVVLKGETTREFLQNRHDMDDGEFTRQKHEQMFIKALVSEIKSMGAVEAAPELYDTFIKFMRTDIDLDEVLNLAGLLDGTSMDDMQFNIMQDGNAEVIDGVWYYRASQDEMLHQMLDAMYNKV